MASNKSENMADAGSLDELFGFANLIYRTSKLEYKEHISYESCLRTAAVVQQTAMVELFIDEFAARMARIEKALLMIR